MGKGNEGLWICFPTFGLHMGQGNEEGYTATLAIYDQILGIFAMQ